MKGLLPSESDLGTTVVTLAAPSAAGDRGSFDFLSPSVPIDDQARHYDQRDTSTCSCGHKPRLGGGGILEVQFCQEVDGVGDCGAVSRR